MNKIEIQPYNSPIQFKELNHSDFNGYNFENNSKTIIEPNNQGYISEELTKIIDLKKKDTTVINASVGQGKTTAIIDFIKWCYQENKYNKTNYKIIIVTPFKALNQEYIAKIEKASNLKDICFEYQELEESGVNHKNYPDFYSKPIQLISIKSILGDAGTVAFKQSDKKRNYYEYLINKCKKNNEKVILIFDEIHESLDSFKPELLPNLFKWKEVTHKILVASATFSEPSIIAIKFLAQLTEKKLRIIESKRRQNEKNLSELHLCFYNQFYYKKDDQYIKDLIEEQIKEASTVNILCYSRKLAQNIYDSSIGEMIKNKFDSINLCTSDKENFKHGSCNIGTRFKTGISIEKENSVYFVILPLRFAYAPDAKENPFGIFTDRINSLIQALARPRNKSKIFVIAPSPLKLITISGNNKKYIKDLSLGYLKFDEKKFQSPYLPLAQQDSILRNFYNENKSYIKEEIKEVENLDSNIKSLFPSYDWFKLKEGQRFLYTQYDAYGKNLSNYVYWAAWNNQFVNCKLKSIIKVSTYKFSEGNVQSMLDDYFNESFYSDAFFTLNSDKDCYHKIRNTLYSNNLFYKKKGESEYSKIEPYRNSNFEQQLITFIQRKKIAFNYDFRKLVYPPNGEPHNYKNGKIISKNKPLDITPKKETYFRICMTHSKSITESTNDLENIELQIINSYNTILKYKTILINEYAIKGKKGDLLIPIDSEIEFQKTHLIELISTFETLIKTDRVLNAYSVKSLKTPKAIYSLLRKLFFETSNTTNPKGEGKILKIKREIPLPKTENYINLIYNRKDAWLYQEGKMI